MKTSAFVTSSVSVVVVSIIAVIGLSGAGLTENNIKNRLKNEPGNGNMHRAAKVQLLAADPLDKVMQDEDVDDIGVPLTDVARGEVATIQLVVANGNAPLSNLDVEVSGMKGQATGKSLPAMNIRYVTYIRAAQPLMQKAATFRYANNAVYPDPLVDNVDNVSAGNNQPIWLTVKIPNGQQADTYTGTVTVKGNSGANAVNLNKTIQVKVYPVTLTDDQPWITNWWNTSANTKKMLNNSNTDGSLTKMIATKMAQNNINSFIVDIYGLTDWTLQNGKYNFDFSRLDDQIKLFLNAGLDKRIEGTLLGGRVGDWNSNYQMLMPQRNPGGGITFTKKPVTDSDVKAFYGAFLPALVNFLKSKGYYQRYYQHVADEPSDPNVASYNQLFAFVKQIVPDLKIIDAVQTDKVDKRMDVVVPELDMLANRYSSFQDVQRAGHEVGFYTCWTPQGNFANRLIQMELIKTRYLPWIAFRYNLTGYLHWAFNQWNNNPNADPGKNAGDAFIVYPGRGKINSSIRLEAQRDGVNDYTLLTMLRKKSPKAAASMASDMIQDFDQYELDLTKFRKARVRLLTQLSQ